jgi:hypothetical protein
LLLLNLNINTMTQKLKLLFKALYAFAFFLLLVGCQKDFSPSENNSEEIVLSSHSNDNATIIRTVNFNAVALIGYCYGENIAFGGVIEEKVHKSTNKNGTVIYVRSFNAKGMTGTGVVTGETFTVIGGNEMFAIKNPVMGPVYPNLPASMMESDILIHQGTLVFQSDWDSKKKVVARHVMRVTPGPREGVNKWLCAGN